MSDVRDDASLRRNVIRPEVFCSFNFFFYEDEKLGISNSEISKGLPSGP